MRSSWVPFSMTAPRDITAMMSAVWMVDSLWAMTMQVRPFLASSRADWTVCRHTEETFSLMFCSSILIHAQMCITNNYGKETHVTFSLSVSRAEVASSSSRILGFRTIARAMAMRCFSPLESCEPWAPTCVSYFLKRTEISRKGQNRVSNVSLTSTTQIQDIGFAVLCGFHSHPAASWQSRAEKLSSKHR